MDILKNSVSRDLRSKGVAFGYEPDGCLVIEAICGEVGDLVISFENAEITVFIGDLTHCHFTPDSPNLLNECVLEAVDFVNDILQDRIVIWNYPNGAGGCYEIGNEEDPMADAPIKDSGEKCFIWSGPYQSTGAS
jgi:hypothetical protein